MMRIFNEPKLLTMKRLVASFRTSFCAGSVLALVFLISCAALTGCDAIKRTSRPQINFTPDSVDLGKVEEGTEIKTQFGIKNAGNADLKIFEAHSTCGCTVPSLQKSTLVPGESTKLDVTIDTTMKQGPVTKNIEVSSNDPTRPVVSLTINLDVNNRHVGLDEGGKAKIFTDEKCTSCHVDRGVGLGGQELFEADCAMCHGEDAKGAVGAALIYGNYDDPKYRKHVLDVISYGSRTHRSMPGFLDKAGGPLIKEQIDSLVVYLAALSKKEKSKRDAKEHEENQDLMRKTEGQVESKVNRK